MRIARAGLCVAWLLAGCGGGVFDGATGGVEEPIIGGSNDNGDPSVVMLRAGSSGFCTGTLVTPTVVLTAAHCVSDGDTDNVGFGINGSSTPAAVKEYHTHGSADIAVLILKSAVTNVIPVPANLAGSTAPRAGSPVRIVGFGQNTADGGFGTKRTASTTVTGIASDYIDVGRTGQQKCFGDSGGPTFFTGSDGVARVVGVTHGGNGDCTGGGSDTRVDTYASFLRPYLGSGGGSGGGAITLPFSGKCLDVAAAASANGTKIQEYTCNGSAAQSFHLAGAPNAAGASTIVHDATGKCVDIDHSGTADFTKAQLWDCNGTGAQSFAVENVGNGNVRFVNTNSGKCLDINGASAADGTQVQLYSCNGTVAQTWHVAP